MEDVLKPKYDIIVYGTGLTECLIAGAASRIGKSVLHLDQNTYYGSQWTSHSLQSLLHWMERVKNHETETSFKTQENIPLNNDKIYSNLNEKWYVPQHLNNSNEIEKVSESFQENLIHPTQKPNDSEHSQESLMNDSRRFNIDLAPKVLYSRGPMVELLISSNVARYVEFKSINRLLCFMEPCNSLALVPCSREQVFNSKSVSLIQKRMLVKFLEFVMSYEDHKEEWEERSEERLSDFIRSRKIADNVNQFIMNGMAMGRSDINVKNGLHTIHLFLKSLGRYGPSAFLSCLYGSGELPQAFCRLSAVFEGTYVLERAVSSVSVEDGKVVSVTSGDQRISCDHLVMEDAFVPTELRGSDDAADNHKSSLARAVLILSVDLLRDFSVEDSSMPEQPDIEPSVPNSGVSLVVLNGSRGQPIVVQQFAPITGTTAPKTFLLHLTCDSEGSPAEEDLRPSLEKLLSHYRASVADSCEVPVLFELFFNQVCGVTHSKISNLHPCGGPDSSLDYSKSVGRAKEIIVAMFGEEVEFMPRAPDPDEIIFDGDNPSDRKEEVEGCDGESESVSDKTEQGKRDIESEKTDNSKVERDCGNKGDDKMNGMESSQPSS